MSLNTHTHTHCNNVFTGANHSQRHCEATRSVPLRRGLSAVRDDASLRCLCSACLLPSSLCLLFIILPFIQTSLSRFISLSLFIVASLSHRHPLPLFFGRKYLQNYCNRGSPRARPSPRLTPLRTSGGAVRVAASVDSDALFFVNTVDVSDECRHGHPLCVHRMLQNNQLTSVPAEAFGNLHNLQSL